MIQSILYRELICQGIDDITKDEVVRQYYTSKGLPFSAYDMYNDLGLAEKVRDSSTGIGQIFAKTAIIAEREVNKNKSMSIGNEDNLWKMWKNLQDNKINIYYVALVLKREAKILKSNINKATREEMIKIFGRYNGNIAYGKHVIQYYDLFVMYNTYEINDLMNNKI